MIAFVRGMVFDVKPEYVVLEANGIGYRIYMSDRDISKMCRNEDCLVYTYLQVKEDGMALFGFRKEDDLEIFKLLISVSGVGPKTALACLSLYEVNDIKFAILSEDDKTLSKVPGLGNKTAKKIILELKDKISVSDTIEDNFREKEGSTGSQSVARNDALLALTSLGYSQTEALRAISNIEGSEDMDAEEIIKNALKQLAFM